jgi:hypothetical protein
MQVVTGQAISHSRRIEGVAKGQPTTDGAGVRLVRIVAGPALQRRLDPFLMLDAFGSDNPDDYIAGFPDHPHRGFETVTYMLHGRMRHKDSAGNEGLVGPGGVQWMTAGRGVIHSEIPEQRDGVMAGFQLWLNLPSAEKMNKPWYRDFEAADVPQFENEGGVRTVLIAGESHGVRGAVTRAATRPIIADVIFPSQGGRFEQALPSDFNAFVYVYEGEAQIAGKSLPRSHLAILANEDGADGVSVAGSPDARVLLVAGRPLREPIVQYGPFVMNSEAEIRQAFSDYRSGRLALTN